MRMSCSMGTCMIANVRYTIHVHTESLARHRLTEPHGLTWAVWAGGRAPIRATRTRPAAMRCMCLSLSHTRKLCFCMRTANNTITPIRACISNGSGAGACRTKGGRRKKSQANTYRQIPTANVKEKTCIDSTLPQSAQPPLVIRTR